MAKTKRRRPNTLTAERARELFRYERSTGRLIRRIKVGKTKAGDVVGSRSSSGYLTVTVDYKTQLVHRVIWLIETGAFPEHEIDHRDTDKTNDRWSNLRVATSGQQKQNMRTRKDNKTGLKWVRSHHSGKFQATIQVTLGTYATPQRAHEVAKRFARRVHAEFFNPGDRNRGASAGMRS